METTIMETTPPSAEAHWNRSFWCVFYGGGIIVTLLLHGVMQEKIMTVPFGGELFTVCTFLVFCNRIASVTYAASMIGSLGENFEQQAPIWKYAVISISNLAASICQYQSLRYVSFPMQMLGKSFKMMPVMFWGMAVSGKRHSIEEWLVALCVTAGVAEFCMTGPTGSTHDRHNTFYGILLLLMFLAFDGLTSVLQEKLFKDHNTTAYNQIFYINGGSAVASLVTLLAMGSMPYCVAFSTTHSEFGLNVAVLSMAAAASQYFITSQVKEYGALVFAATLNVRQVVSILVSYAIYHHLITWRQAGGLMVVFAALFWKSYMALSFPTKPKGKDVGEKAPLLHNPQEPLVRATV